VVRVRGVGVVVGVSSPDEEESSSRMARVGMLSEAGKFFIVLCCLMICVRIELSSLYVKTWFFLNNSSKGVLFLLRYEKVMGWDWTRIW